MSRATGKKLFYGCMALSFTVALTPIGQAISPINSTQDSRIIHGGTYYNTADSSTTFTNSHANGLWLQSGVNVRGLELNSSHNLTNNGGAIHLNAPGQVVRVDGNINVNANTNGSGAYLGNGGNVLIDSTYLYQNGKITAIGNQGGHMTFTVNSATFGPLAKVDASGGTNGGGSIYLLTSGVVNIQKGATLETIGAQRIPRAESNIIYITGSIVNNQGVLNANGISKDNSATNGGTIQLYSDNSNSNIQPVAKALTNSSIFTAAQGNALFNQLQGLAQGSSVSIRNTGSMTANGGTTIYGGGDGGNGGTISLEANNNSISNLSTGVITVNGGAGNVGGHGGYIDLPTAPHSLVSQNAGQIQANGGAGNGNETSTAGIAGNGGNISLGSLINSGSISANGGDGGTYTGGHGGNGGVIDAISLVNKPLATLSAIGGSGSGQGGGIGGSGGNLTVTNFTNNGSVSLNGGGAFGVSGNTAGDGGHFQGGNVINTGTIFANGGSTGAKGPAKGGLGGHIKITNLTNSNIISANGGSGDNGSDGGLLTFSKVTNTGTLTANGGNTYFNSFGSNFPAGDGGIIIVKQAIKSGKVQALGGKSGFSPSLNGQDGTVMGF